MKVLIKDSLFCLPYQSTIRPNISISPIFGEEGQKVSNISSFLDSDSSHSLFVYLALRHNFIKNLRHLRKTLFFWLEVHWSSDFSDLSTEKCLTGLIRNILNWEI